MIPIANNPRISIGIYGGGDYAGVSVDHRRHGVKQMGKAPRSLCKRHPSLFCGGICVADGHNRSQFGEILNQCLTHNIGRYGDHDRNVGVAQFFLQARGFGIKGANMLFCMGTAEAYGKVGALDMQPNDASFLFYL